MLKALDMVELSSLTCLLDVVWSFRITAVEWQTSVVAPIFKKGDRRMCFNYSRITLFSLPRKVNSRVLERRFQLIVEPWIQEE